MIARDLRDHDCSFLAILNYQAFRQGLQASCSAIPPQDRQDPALQGVGWLHGLEVYQPALQALDNDREGRRWQFQDLPMTGVG